MIDYQKKERKAYIRFILFMLKNMNMHQLRKALDAVTGIYESF